MEATLAGTFPLTILIIAIIPIILCIILFFKVWAMANNIKDIKEILKDWIDLEHPFFEDDKNTNNKPTINEQA